MNEPNFELLFPTPVMFNSIGRDFTKEELAYIESHSTATNRNVGNVTSNNNYILNEPEMADLNKFITKQLNEYVKRVYKPKFPAEVFVTQSWLNWTKKGEFHHKHEHPNSFISGVFYVNAIKNEDMIKFYKDFLPMYQINHNQPNNYNSGDVTILVETGDLVLFPSNFQHNVPPTTSKETRISISFNTFIRGNLGDEDSSTALYLK